jgi:hypothetical protein
VPKSVLTRKRSWIARFAVLAMVFSLMAVALPASAHSVAIDTSTPCPAATPSAGFTDIGGFDATTQLAINCLFAFGITTGTSATTYSPNDTTTRWQMALFLVRQAADHGLTIPTAVPQGYTDILTLPQSTQDAINQITQLGISKGTSTTTFSPFDGVSRWQMALFIYRLGVAAGVTFTNDSAHNEFTDIGGTLAEAQTAINALADAHVALGTGGSAFSPNLLLVRWQMALFLTRLLAADGIAAPAGLRVTVTPTASASQGIGTARTYVATFKNADGTNYTGRVGIALVEASSGNPVYNDPVEQVFIESASDGLAPIPSVVGPGVNTSTGVAGSDGSVTFTIRHTGAAEDTIPVAWEDLDLDGTYETTGNVAPTEPFGLGGLTDFVAGPAAEAVTGPYTVTVSKTTKASDVFEGTFVAGTACPVGPCSFFYDSGDIFTVDGAAASLQEFEDALSVGDTVSSIPPAGGVYDADTADQSTFNLTDTVTTITVTDPAAATTVDAATYAIKGTGDPGATVRIRQDVPPLNPPRDAADGIVATGTVDADGNWTVATPLAQGVVNHFLASQVPVGGSEGASVDVLPITEGASAGATLLSTVGAETVNPPLEAGLGPSDTITITFSEGVSGVSSGDTIGLVDSDGTTATLTLGADVSFALSTTTVTNDTLTLTINVAVPGSGGTTGGIDGSTNITSIAGFTDDDGEAINVAGSGAGRTFDAP